MEVTHPSPQHTHTHTQLLQQGRKLVLEQIVTTTATVADTVEEAFVPYYDKFMPSLKYIMSSALGKDYRMLRGKTIECISLIGLAVGQEKVRGVVDTLVQPAIELFRARWSAIYHSSILSLLPSVHARRTGGDGHVGEGAE